MRRLIGFALLAAVISGCTSASSSESQRAATDAPEPADPSDVTYVDWKDTAFAVIESAEADALFEQVTTCTSEEGGYTVAYPSSWHTNEGGQAPGCSWFGPIPFAQAPATLVAVVRPLNVPIQLSVLGGGLAQVGGGPQPVGDQVVIGGLEGLRMEFQVQAQPPWWSYAYSAWLAPAFEGLNFRAETTSAADGDYMLHKAVLDRMMATLEFASRPAAANYVEKDGYPFTVLESAEADTLFETPDTCTNPVAGYTVTFPDDWYTNTEIGDWPACTWFSPTFYEVPEDPNEVPPEIAIVLQFGDMSFGYTDEPDFSIADGLTIDGFGATRAEMIGHTAPSGVYFPISPMYWYIVTIVEQAGDQPTLYARTDLEGATDYELNKAVLDRIMALIEFEE